MLQIWSREFSNFPEQLFLGTALDTLSVNAQFIKTFHIFKMYVPVMIFTSAVHYKEQKLIILNFVINFMLKILLKMQKIFYQ